MEGYDRAGVFDAVSGQTKIANLAPVLRLGQSLRESTTDIRIYLWSVTVVEQVPFPAWCLLRPDPGILGSPAALACSMWSSLPDPTLGASEKDLQSRRSCQPASATMPAG
jgi:hypothetical protein